MSARSFAAAGDATAPGDGPVMPRRRATLADALILIAATAAAFTWIRYADGLGIFEEEPNRQVPRGRYFVGHTSFLSCCLLTTYSLATLILAARRPRPALREVLAGSGVIACVAAMIAAALAASHFAAALALFPLVDPNRLQENYDVTFITNFHNAVVMVGHWAGPMISGAWLALALAGRWRPLPAWPDRLGFALGACWILIYWLDQAYFALQPLFRR